MKGAQLPLAVTLAEHHRFENFHPGPNAAAVAATRALIDGDGIGLLLHGPAGCGKTHLGDALQHEAAALGLTVAALAAGDLGAASPSERATRADVLTLDGLDRWSLDDAAALQLLRLLDRRSAAGRRTLITASRPVAAWDPATPPLRADLLTRLSTLPAFGLKPLDDAHRQELLQLKASAKGLLLPGEVAAYLIKHLARDTGSLIRAVQQLDEASLAAQRRLTIPFVQDVLGLSG